MKNILRIFAAGLLATAALGSAAYAGQSSWSAHRPSVKETYGNGAPTVGSGVNGHNEMKTSASMDGDDYMVEPSKTAMMDGSDKVEVLTLKEIPRAKAAFLKTRAKTNPQAVKDLRASIRSHPSVVSALRAENVNVNDVIGERVGADGSVAFIIS